MSRFLFEDCDVRGLRSAHGATVTPHSQPLAIAVDAYLTLSHPMVLGLECYRREIEEVKNIYVFFKYAVSLFKIFSWFPNNFTRGCDPDTVCLTNLIVYHYAQDPRAFHCSLECSKLIPYLGPLCTSCSLLGKFLLLISTFLLLKIFLITQSK